MEVNRIIELIKNEMTFKELELSILTLQTEYNNRKRINI